MNIWMLVMPFVLGGIAEDTLGQGCLDNMAEEKDKKPELISSLCESLLVRQKY